MKSLRFPSVPLFLLSIGVACAGEPCRSVGGIEPLLAAGKVLLLGEVHGTEESPAFALDVACHAARAKLPVIVALELSPRDQVRVDAFLESKGTDKDRRSLFAGSPWQSTYQDGRTSWAMFDLIDGVRKLRGEGLSVDIALFDAPAAGGGRQRDRAMGLNLAAVVADSPKSMVIGLTGNHHSRITAGAPWDSNYETMGYVLGKETSFDNLVSLNVAHGAGSAWVCAPECGVTSLAGKHGDRQWTVEIDDATRPAGHLGWYHVGAIHASSPARLPRIASPPAPVSEDLTSRTVSGGTRIEEPAAAASERVLTSAESKIQGAWQAYDFGSNHKTWLIHFDRGSFHAQAGADDWYKGQISLHEAEPPWQIDFEIADCRCSYKGMTSEGIFFWDGESIVIAAPRPGAPRPARFNETSGQMMRLVRLGP